MRPSPRHPFAPFGWPAQPQSRPIPRLTDQLPFGESLLAGVGAISFLRRQNEMIVCQLKTHTISRTVASASGLWCWPGHMRPSCVRRHQMVARESAPKPRGRRRLHPGKDRTAVSVYVPDELLASTLRPGSSIWSPHRHLGLVLLRKIATPNAALGSRGAITDE